MQSTRYEWTVGDVRHKTYQVMHKSRGLQWCIWREWKDSSGYPQIDVEWFDTLNEVFEKYSGAEIQASLGI